MKLYVSEHIWERPPGEPLGISLKFILSTKDVCIKGKWSRGIQGKSGNSEDNMILNTFPYFKRCESLFNNCIMLIYLLPWQIWSLVKRNLTKTMEVVNYTGFFTKSVDFLFKKQNTANCFWSWAEIKTDHQLAPENLSAVLQV